jgi:hypothetical protein
MKGKNNMNKITKVAVALIAALAMNSGYASLIITGASASSCNFALSNDSILTNGAIFQIGYYNSAVTSASFSGLSSASAFETGWTSLASSTANAFDVPGLRSATADIGGGINTHEGKSLVMLVGNSSTISGSTQVGVFSNSSWIVPVNPTGIIPTDYAFDVSDEGTQALFGSLRLGTGAYPGDGVVNSANLQAIPEPSSASLLALGVAGLVALRARRKS